MGLQISRMVLPRLPSRSGRSEFACQPSGTEHGAGSDRFYGRFAVFVAWLPLIAAIPQASNRPVWWLLWCAVIGFGAAIYFIKSARPDRGCATASRPLAAFIVIALLVPGFAALQAVPMAGQLPDLLTALPARLSDELRPASLSLVPSASVLGAMRAIGLILFFALVVEVSSRTRGRNRICRILFFGVTAHAAWGLVALNLLEDTVWWGIKNDHLGFATGTFVNRNSFATFLGFGLILGLAMQLRPLDRSGGTERNIAQRLEGYMHWGCILVIAFALLATQSRLGLGATITGAAVTAILMRSSGQRGLLRGVAEVGMAAVLVMAVGLILGGDALVQRLVLVPSEYDARLQIHRQVASMIGLRPWTGYGYDAFGPAFTLFRQAPLLAEGEIDLAHNSYLTLWAELGLIVGSLPILLLGWVGFTVTRCLRCRPSRVVPAAALGALVLAGVHSTGDFSLEILANDLMLAAILGTGFSHATAANKPVQDDCQPDRCCQRLRH
jgi:O-antigen ligase